MRPISPRRPRLGRSALLAAAFASLALSTAPVDRVEAGVAFCALRNGVWTVYVQESEKDGARPVRGDLAFDAAAPALSPDGSRVAFEVPGQGILVCPVKGSERCQTLKTDLGWPVRPTWNPKTGELVFARFVADSSGEDSDLLVASPALDAVRPLVHQTGNQDSPDVSPDGRFLLYDSAQTVSLHRAGPQVVRHLWVMDLESGAAGPLVPGAGQDMQPDLSPDGRRVAFASDRGGEGFEIWVVGVDGEGLRQVTSGDGGKSWPAWSPDGKALLYTRTHEGRTELWRTAADGSGAEIYRPLGTGSDEQLRDADWR